MNTLLYNALVNKDNPIDIEICRLEKFRGLDKPTGETDINSFLKHYFSKDSVPGYTVYYDGHHERWAKCFASSNLRDLYIDPLNLDPFIARYIIAINKIGIKTYYSCDGWHTSPDKNEIVIGFKEPNSLVYHKVICGKFLDNHLNWKRKDNFIYIPLPKDDKDKLDIYMVLNKNAEYFEEQEDRLYSLKEKLIAKLKYKQKNNLTNEQLELLISKTIDELIK